MKPRSVGRPLPASTDAATMLAETWLPSEPPIERMIVFIPLATPKELERLFGHPAPSTRATG